MAHYQNQKTITIHRSNPLSEKSNILLLIVKRWRPPRDCLPLLVSNYTYILHLIRITMKKTILQETSQMFMDYPLMLRGARQQTQ